MKKRSELDYLQGRHPESPSHDGDPDHPLRRSAEDEVHEVDPRDPEVIAAQLNSRLEPEGAALFGQYRFEVQARTDELQASLRQSQAEKQRLEARLKAIAEILKEPLS